jgi:hypothetical protein
MIYQNTLHYRIVEEFGGGCTRVVYKAVLCKAKDARLHRFVARKSLPEELSKEPRARFQRETLATSARNHPNMNPGRGGGAWV